MLENTMSKAAFRPGPPRHATLSPDDAGGNHGLYPAPAQISAFGRASGSSHRTDGPSTLSSGPRRRPAPTHTGPTKLAFGSMCAS